MSTMFLLLAWGILKASVFAIYLPGFCFSICCCLEAQWRSWLPTFFPGPCAEEKTRSWAS